MCLWVTDVSGLHLALHGLERLRGCSRVCTAQVAARCVAPYVHTWVKYNINTRTCCGHRWLMDEVEHGLLTQHLHVSQGHQSYRMPICYSSHRQPLTHTHTSDSFNTFPLSSCDLHQFPQFILSTYQGELSFFSTKEAFQFKRNKRRYFKRTPTPNIAPSKSPNILKCHANV